MIPLVGTGGLFTRIGAVCSTINSINAQRGTAAIALTSAIDAQYNTTDQNIVTNLYTYLLSYQSGAGAYMPGLQKIAQDTITQMANDDLAQSSRSSLSDCLNYLISQMQGASQTIQSCLVSASVLYASGNIGNPNIVVSMKDVYGHALENAFYEQASAAVTNDGQSSSSLAMQEQITITCPLAASDSLGWDYPIGSGVRYGLSAVNALNSQAGGNQNWLNNSSFESFTVANIPDGWNVWNGMPGSTIFQTTATASVYDGQSALRFLGNGSEFTTLYQQFSSSYTLGDTVVAIYPDQQFAVNLWLKVSSVPAAGVLRVALWSGSAVINDDAGTPNQLSINLNSLSSSVWTPFSASFRTPFNLPSQVSIQLALTTALSNGVSLYVDRLAFSQMSQLYKAGPYVTIFSGNINMIRDDTYWLRFYNNYGGQFQRFFDRLFNMKTLGLVMPSSQSPTIPDSLMVIGSPTGSGGGGGGSSGGGSGGGPHPP